MVQIVNLFTNKRLIIGLVCVTFILLIAAALVLGLTLGLVKCKSIKHENDSINKTCRGSLEGYPISGTSKLGKYSQAAIAVDDAQCAHIGRNILERNGTAVDAMIAAAICDGVMNSHSMGIGGGCVMVIYSKERNKAYSLIGREQAPFRANATMFVDRPLLSTIGGLSVAVPGELRAYRKAYEEFGGGVSWSELFEPTIRLCRDGFRMSKILATALKQMKSYILQDPGMREIFVKNLELNELYDEGDMIKRVKFARTLEIIAQQGVETFYTGQLADLIVDEIQNHSGIITKQDLANYQVDFREAIAVELNQSLTTFVAHPPSSGVLFALIMNILKGYEFRSNQLDNPVDASLFYHRMIEAFKFAYAERTELADPLKTNITELIEKLVSIDFANQIRQRIDDSKTNPYRYYGGVWFDQIKTGTSHLSVIGRNGDAVAMTSSLNLYFGSTISGMNTGIIYNNHMDDFSTPHTVNSFGIPASKANFIAPGKRPISSMAPTIIFDNKNQRVLQVIGASGGSKITTSTVQVSMLNLWFNKNIKQATDMPRLHSQLLPDEVLAEQGFNETILNELKKRGHNIQCNIYGGSIVQGIEWRKQENQLWACADVRKNGAPDGI